jgi:hypothetical protein
MISNGEIRGNGEEMVMGYINAFLSGRNGDKYEKSVKDSCPYPTSVTNTTHIQVSHALLGL